MNSELECKGCGAPLQPRDIKCSYCLRATWFGADMVEMLEVTTLTDAERKFAPRLMPQPAPDWR